MPNRGNLNKYINMATFKTRIPNRGLLNKFKNGGYTSSEINTTGKKIYDSCSRQLKENFKIT